MHVPTLLECSICHWYFHTVSSRHDREEPVTSYSLWQLNIVWGGEGRGRGGGGGVRWLSPSLPGCSQHRHCQCPRYTRVICVNKVDCPPLILGLLLWYVATCLQPCWWVTSLVTWPTRSVAVTTGAKYYLWWQVGTGTSVRVGEGKVDDWERLAYRQLGE